MDMILGITILDSLLGGVLNQHIEILSKDSNG